MTQDSDDAVLHSATPLQTPAASLGDPNDVRERILEIICDVLGLQPSQVTAETRLSDHGDSLDAVDIIMELEEEFEIRIPDEEAQTLQTVGQIHGYVLVEIGKGEEAG